MVKTNTSAKRTLILQHTDATTPGSVPSLLDQLGQAYDLGQLHRGFTLPDIKDYDALIVCGGGIHVHQEDQYPFLRPEKDFIAAALQRGVKTMGLCLGAQLIATVLGGDCFPNEGGWEIGWHEVECLAHPRTPGFARAQVRRVSQYHRYVFSLPPGAELLARNAFVPVQAFRFKDHVLAFGFHPERDLSSHEAIALETDRPTTGRCQSTEEMRRFGAECAPVNARWFKEILAGFLS